MTNRAPLFTCFALLLAACATQAADRVPRGASLEAEPAAVEPSEPSEPAEPYKNNPCGPEAQTMCMDDDRAECCTIAAIPHQYELLEARSTGDASAEALHQSRLDAVVSHGCDLGNEESCELLERLVSAAR